MTKQEPNMGKGHISRWAAEIILLVAGALISNIHLLVGSIIIAIAIVLGLADLLWDSLNPSKHSLRRLIAYTITCLIVGGLAVCGAVWTFTPTAPLPQAEKPVAQQLLYRICDAELSHVPNTHRLMRLALEFDPINPNNETTHIVGKRSFLVFDGVPSKVTVAGKSLDITPRANVRSGTKVPNFKDWVIFNPSRRETGSKFGRYHYEFRFGTDEDNATRSFEINGSFEIVFGSDGRPEAGPNFGPSGDTNITFDPAQCPFSW
jgi:hypothetical protein